MNNPLNQSPVDTPEPILTFEIEEDCSCANSGSSTGGGSGGNPAGWRAPVRIARDDPRWSTDSTFIEPGWNNLNYFVYANGSKILTPEFEGFAYVTGGGFTYDDTRFQFYTGEFLYIIF